MRAPTIRTVGELFSGATTYKIPVYQRNYAWGEVQIKQLIDDVCDAWLDPGIDEYFLGNLVVSARSGTEFEVVDGQQRLTTLFLLLSQLRLGAGSLRSLVYESRSRATLALERLIAGGNVPERTDVDYSAEDEGILAGSKVIAQYLGSEGTAKRLREKEAAEFLMDKVVVVQVHIPEDTDLNRYFEIMNTRGKQLLQQDIVKARLMSELPDAADQACFAWLWDACADMDSYVQMRLTGGDTRFRSALFGDDWSWLAPCSFENVNRIYWARAASAGDAIRSHSSSSVPLGEALIAYSQAAPYDAGDRERARFTSSMVFSTFLLHVLKVVSPGDEREAESQLDDKRLVKWFDAEIRARGPEDATAWVKGFAYALLKCRFLFDNYVLKREFTGTTADDDDWSLRRLTVGRSGPKWFPRYVSSFGYVPAEGEGAPDDVGREIALLQQALRVTYTSPRTMHWITRVLQHLWPMTNREQVEADAVLTLLRGYARGKVAESFRQGDLTTGFGINRIVFTYLDYTLAVRDRDLGFRFTYRNSIEHFYPQAVDPTAEYPALDSDETKELFGNLALVSVSDNSKFSNSLPSAKAVFTAIVKQSPKLQLMAAIAKSGAWDDAAIRQHHHEMVSLLRADIRLRKR